MVCLLMMVALAGCGGGVKNLALVDGTTTSSGQVFQTATYGVKGDGVTDDGPAIEKTIEAAMFAGGGQVSFPCGEFLLKSVAGSAPGSRSLLYFKGASGIQITGQGHCSHIYTAMPQKSVLEFEDSTGISITSVRLSALNAVYVEHYGMDGGSAIRFTGVKSGNISQVEVDGSSAGALYLTKGTSSTSVSNNNIHDTDGSAIWEDDCSSASATSCNPSTPPTDNVYDSNTFTNTSLLAGAAILVDDGNGVSNAVIQNNTVSWNELPLASYTGPGVHCIQVNNASAVNILNNNCANTPWDAIVVTTGQNGISQGVTIKGNTMTNSGTASTGGSGIVVYDAPLGKGVSGFTVSSNTITTASTDGIGIFAASKPGNVQQGLVENNTIQMVDQRQPGSRYGIIIQNSANITVDLNSVTGNGKCIAVGVNVLTSTATAPTKTSNQVVNIVGTPLWIH